MSYLARQGYNYEDIKDALSEDSDYSAWAGLDDLKGLA
jgi:SOS response regulatory protein OraA/RecX